MSFNNEMFASIKEALTKPQQSSNFKDILKLEPDPKPYIVRLIPDIKNPRNTFYHYFSHGWNSVSTGQYLAALSPTTWGERDPIAEARFVIHKNGTEEEKKKSKLLNRHENWMVNVFVIQDPKHPENNNQVKILRIGRKLKKVIDEAIEGEDAAEFGPKIFDLSVGGCNFKIKAEKQGDFTTYDGSKFVSASEIPGMTEAMMKEVYNGIFDLTKIQQVKSYDELKQMLDEHYYGKVSGKAVASEKKTAPAAVKVEEEEDKIPDTGPVDVASKKNEEPVADDALNDEKIKELLAGLDN